MLGCWAFVAIALYRELPGLGLWLVQGMPFWVQPEHSDVDDYTTSTHNALI